MAQGDLFADDPVVDGLRSYLTGLAGSAVSFGHLVTEARRQGYMEKHLRRTLDDLAAEGMAVLEHPLQARSKWPDDSLVRFYAAGT